MQFPTEAPFINMDYILFPAWVSNYTYQKLWADNTYPFLNFNDATVEFWE